MGCQGVVQLWIGVIGVDGAPEVGPANSCEWMRLNAHQLKHVNWKKKWVPVTAIE